MVLGVGRDCGMIHSGSGVRAGIGAMETNWRRGDFCITSDHLVFRNPTKGACLVGKERMEECGEFLADKDIGVD